MLDDSLENVVELLYKWLKRRNYSTVSVYSPGTAESGVLYIATLFLVSKVGKPEGPKVA